MYRRGGGRVPAGRRGGRILEVTHRGVRCPPLRSIDLVKRLEIELADDLADEKDRAVWGDRLGERALGGGLPGPAVYTRSAYTLYECEIKPAGS